MPDTPLLELYNVDVQLIVNKLSRFGEEINKNQSSVVSGFREADVKRFQSYIDALSSTKTFVESLPILDTPITHQHGNTIEVKPFPEIAMTDNDAVNTIVRIFQMMWQEMLFSQSSRVSSGMLPEDLVRYSQFLERLQSLIDNYIAPTTYEDLPETMPSFSVPAGNARFNLSTQ